MEKFQARQISNNLKQDVTRRNVKVIELDEEGSDDFWEILGGKPDKIKSAEEGGSDIQHQKKKDPILFKLSDASGKIEFERLKDSDLKKSDLDTNDAFVLDINSKVFAWVGSKASKTESKLAIVYATDYLKNHGRPAHTPVLSLKEGQPNSEFYSYFK